MKREFYVVVADDTTDIFIGRQGENNVTEVIFDFEEVKELFGEGTATLLYRRPSDATPYPVVLEFNDNFGVWSVKSLDLEKKGVGECEIRYVVDGKIVKSRIYSVNVARALGTESPAPDPWESWIDEILAAAERAESASLSAAISAENAEEASERYPYIRDTDKHWMVWDVAAGEYKDTGVVAEGGGGGGTPTWTGILNKPFERLGANLKVVGDALTVDTAGAVEQDNTRPITSAAVYTEVGNINALLALI